MHHRRILLVWMEVRKDRANLQMFNISVSYARRAYGVAPNEFLDHCFFFPTGSQQYVCLYPEILSRCVDPMQDLIQRTVWWRQNVLLKLRTELKRTFGTRAIYQPNEFGAACTPIAPWKHSISCVRHDLPMTFTACSMWDQVSCSSTRVFSPDRPLDAKPDIAASAGECPARGPHTSR